MSKWRKADLLIRTLFVVPLILLMLYFSLFRIDVINPVYISACGLAVMMLALGVNSWRFDKRKDAKINFVCGGVLLVFILWFQF
ncbi:hypothetical protein [Alkalicoccobacillus plakortidis]|uniref:Uncharacterized protein n=1 Tax=Alkalicoccobacillus plakortidis TaxID=444060 RepID=A0ABT0XL95_9BACI|nr:hypothetical protein [Alkalicoccobacillus plakortidis]MCM2676612.1 hypothetical protein [Alkalicoccobacillus plakortidis]